MSAISRSTIGRIATSPCSKNRRWRSTIACATRRIVSKRCCTLRISHLASCSCAAELLVRRFAVARQDVGVDPVQAQLGHRGFVERRYPLAANLAYDHVRERHSSPRRLANDAPGRGFKLRISSRIALTQASSQCSTRFSLVKSRAGEQRQVAVDDLQRLGAKRRRSPAALAAAAPRHSAGSRAPTPAGSKLCRYLRPIVSSSGSSAHRARRTCRRSPRATTAR